MPTPLDLVAVVGPTAVGKTNAAIFAAERVAAEIVSVDSRQIYRGMDIGTAKPTRDQMARVPHHLIDVADPRHPWSLVDYCRAALEAIGAIQARDRLPMLVGGTGQYFTALLEGWDPPPKDQNNQLRHEFEAFARERGSAALHQRLAEVDPVSAARIDHRNVRRVVRALEICHLSGEPASKVRRKSAPPFNVLRIGLTMSRQKLYARIDRRIDDMLEMGLVDEVKTLLTQGIDAENPIMSAIGYRQIADHLMGKIDLEEAVSRMRRLSRQFVRRQANWFKADDPEIHWLITGADVGNEMVRLIEGWRSAEDGSG